MYAKYLLLGIGSLALLVVALRHDLNINEAQQQPPSKPPVYEQSQKRDPRTANAAGEKDTAAQPPVVVPSSPSLPLKNTSDAEPERRHEEGKESWWNRLQTDPVATFTAALALFTLVLAGVAVWQGVHLQRSVEVARKAAEVLPILERAYLDFEIDPNTANIVGSNMSGQNPSALILYRFANYGKTPAIVGYLDSILTIGGNAPDLAEPMRVSHGDIMIAANTLHPAPYANTVGSLSQLVNYGFRVSMRFTKEDAAAVAEGKTFIWFAGKLAYRDIFDAATRETVFCYRYSVGERGRRFERYGGDDYNRRT